MTSSASGPVTYNTGANPSLIYIYMYAHGCDKEMLAQATDNEFLFVVFVMLLFQSLFVICVTV